jgi:hypothetical protein
MTMSEIKMRRRSRQVPITLTTSTASATTLYLEDFAGGVIDIGTIATAATTLQMWGGSTEGGTFRRVYNTDGSVADITLTPSTAVGGIYNLPDACFGLPYLEVIVGNTAGTGVAATITMKS